MRILLIAACICLGISSAQAAHTQAQLILADDSVKAGDTVLVGVHLKMDAGWHTYWRNPGAAGMATKIEWQLPAGVTAGEIQWPLPEKMPPEEVTTYGYENEVVLLVPLKLGADLKPGPVNLKAKLSWLECKEQCIPAGATVEASLDVGTETKPSAGAALLAAWQEKTPQAKNGYSLTATWEKPAVDDARTLIVTGRQSADSAKNVKLDSVDFYPDASEQFEVQPATETISASSADIRFRKVVKKFSGDWPKEISGMLVTQSGNSREGYDLKLSVAEDGVTRVAASSSQPVTPSKGVTESPVQPLAKMLLYAFIGGLILNVMPCVLPVIALKILGFVSEAANDRNRLRKLGLVYLMGVLISFLILALLVIGLKAAGSRVGWGFQFNNPYFLVVITTLVMLIALNLFGVFEITLGGRTLNTAVNLASRRGAAGAFFNGLLATVLATSCTAPYLGSAVGFAFVQPPLIILLVLLTVGVGLAFPYVVLSWQPAWLKFLPKPGAWMEKFKIAMGFPMLAAAIWLCSILSTFYGERTWSLAIFLLIVALAFWVYGQFVQGAGKHRGLAAGIVVLLLVVGYFYGLEGQLRWREPIMEAKGATASTVTPSGAGWQNWSAEAIAKARSEGRPVLVDFTAKWCLTCQKDVKPVLGSEPIQNRLKELNAATLVADYTRFPKDIFDELARHGRAGVPLVLVYPKDGTSPPIILPEAVTRGIVLAALEQAAK